MALPEGYIPGPKFGDRSPIYNSFSGRLAGTIDDKGRVEYFTDTTAGNTNYPQTLAQATAYTQAPAAGAAAPAGAAPAPGVAPAGASLSSATPQSYLTAPSAPTTAPSSGQGSAPMATSSTGTTTTTGGTPQVTPQQAIQYYVSQGGNPNIDANTAMAFFSAQNPNFGVSGVTPQAAINYYIQKGGNPNIDPTTAISFYEHQNPAAVQQGLLQPEQRALQQMGQIDPASEALRTAVAGSYLTPLQQASQNLNQKPTASDYQSYLDLFKQVDPEEYAQRAGMATSMDSYLKAAQDEAALGSQLDPVTARQVAQQTRAGQAARGNVYGTPQMVEEAMTTGQAGMALKQQRQAALGAALGAQQGYLGAGLGLGDTAMNLYQQGLSNQQNRLAQLQSLQGGALSYLGSGQTPYQTGANYVNMANQNAAAAAQGGPVYQPASLGAGQLGTAQQAPQYGLDIGAQTQNWYNSLAAYSGGGAPQKNKGAAAASGAMSGAVSGAAAGAPLAGATYGLSIPIGAVVGGALGGAGGYYS